MGKGERIYRKENGNILMIIKKSEVRQLRKVSWRLNIVIIARVFSFLFVFLIYNSFSFFCFVINSVNR